jgi:hypothetical protein
MCARRRKATRARASLLSRGLAGRVRSGGRVGGANGPGAAQAGPCGLATLVTIFLDAPVVRSFAAADKVIESKSTPLTFELRRADLADAPLGGRRAREYEINPWGLN